ncbi:MAG: hypothetical protein GY811_13440 [Myxococcales bacterium]|nr:hypothetical protein [Myxococcales bacterium]
MTNSEKQIKASAASSKAPLAVEPPVYASRGFWRMVGAVLLIMGMGFSLEINGWHLQAPVVVLWFGWAGVLATVTLMWEAGFAVASEASGDRIATLDVSEARRHELDAEKKSLIQAIKEIEFDRDLGKMSAEDATEMMKFYRARAIETIKELDGQTDEELSVSERVKRDLEARLALAGKGVKRASKSAPAKANGKQDAESPADSDAKESV